jgi:dTDP-4-dehydrorhamnose reductase
MLKIAITGADGLIGSRIIELLNNKFQFIPLPSSLMDITNKDQVYQVLKETNFDLFLHLAAYTNVAQAEIDKDVCFKINVEGTKNVFQAVSFKKKKFIYISTDLSLMVKKKTRHFLKPQPPIRWVFTEKPNIRAKKLSKIKE